MPSPKVAVLGLQGDFQKHIDRLRFLGADAFNARLPEEVESADALVIPGGESTTIGKLLVRFHLVDAIRKAHAAQRPIFGTCAGLILLAKRITSTSSERGGQPTLGLLDITVSRNAFGRQIDSFESTVDAPKLVGPNGSPLTAVFIRAPIVEQAGPDVEVLARHHDQIVFVRQGTVLGASFHPELTDDVRVHGYFLDLVNQSLTHVRSTDLT
jgi:5'-phosphate synthase pdxT subunit